jgi:predicted nucleic acid-binding protein
MTVKAFFDTNVLVYAAVGAGKDEPKRKRAVELIGIDGLRHFGASLAGILCDRGQEGVTPAFRRASPGVD